MSQDKMSAEKSPPIQQVERVRRYVEGVRLEMREVSWPTWNQVWSTTLVVLFFTFAMTVFVTVVDWIAELLYRLIAGK